MQKLMDWKKHHGIEMFGGLLAILLMLLAIDIVGGLSYRASADRDYLSGTPYYASSFVTSRSQVRGEIVAFYTNPGNTKVAIVVRVSEPDALNISSDAKDYQMFLRGFNVSKGAYTSVNLNYPQGGYYVFGTTGYAMIYLVNATGFNEQALEIIVRNNNLITEGNKNDSGDMTALKRANETYSQYDQYRLIINPSAKGATTVDFLDDLDVKTVFRYCILDEQEQSVREKLYEDIAQLNDYMRQINQYKKTLESLGVHVPALPESIRGDQFIACTEAEPCELHSYAAYPGTTTSNGVVTSTTYPVYIPSYVYERGINIDWQHTMLSDEGADFFDELLSEGQTKDQFLYQLSSRTVTQRFSAPLTTEFSMLDGTPLSDSMGNSVRTDEQQIYSVVKAYTTAVGNYLSVKNQYQTIDLVKYLTMQYNMEISGRMFTSNLVDGVITVWG